MIRMLTNEPAPDCEISSLDGHKDLSDFSHFNSLSIMVLMCAENTAYFLCSLT